MRYVFPPPPAVSAAVDGSRERFPVHRIYCVGRNYAAHAREMGFDAAREPPFFFTKPADALVESGAGVPYPPATAELHHEVELVVAIGRGCRAIAAAEAPGQVFGYAVGIDLTRRDLQRSAREQGRPWDTAKGFDRSAPMSAIAPVARSGHPQRGRIWLSVNDALRQQADLSEMIWSVADIVAELSGLFALQPGDLIFTGTPAGVGPVQPGDRLRAGIDGVGELVTSIGPAAAD